MRETLIKQRETYFFGSPLEDLTNPISETEQKANLSTITHIRELSDKGSDLVAQFHSIYDNKMYRGYDNCDQVNRVAKLFGKGRYKAALEESGRDSIKEFVEWERIHVSRLKRNADADLHEMSKYNKNVKRTIADIDGFIEENRSHENKESLEEYFFDRKISELSSLRQSLLEIKAILEIEIKSTIDNSNMLTMLSDSVIHNISMIASVGNKNALKAWNGEYKKKENTTRQSMFYENGDSFVDKVAPSLIISIIVSAILMFFVFAIGLKFDSDWSVYCAALLMIVIFICIIGLLISIAISLFFEIKKSL